MTSHSAVEFEIEREVTADQDYILGPTTDTTSRGRTALIYGAAASGTDTRTIYLDLDNGNDANTGFTLALAKATLAGALAAMSGTRQNLFIERTGAFPEIDNDLGILSIAGVVTYSDVQTIQVALGQTATMRVSVDVTGTSVWPDLKAFDGVRLELLNVGQDSASPFRIGSAVATGPFTFRAFELPQATCGGIAIDIESTATTVYRIDTFRSKLAAPEMTSTTWAYVQGYGSTTLQDWRYGCIWRSKYAISVNFQQTLFTSTGSGVRKGAVLVAGTQLAVSGTPLHQHPTWEMEWVTITGFGRAIMVNHQSTVIQPGSFMGSSILDDAITTIDYDAAIPAAPTGLADFIASFSLINRTRDDSTVVDATCVTGRAPRFWNPAAGDYRLQRAGVAFAPDVPFIKSSPAVGLGSGGIDAGAYEATYTQPGYTGQRLVFPERDGTESLILRRRRVNHQAFDDLSANYYCVWDGERWEIELAWPGDKWVGSDWSFAIARILADRLPKRFHARGRDGVWQADGTVVDTAISSLAGLPRDLPPKAFRDWIARLDSPGDDTLADALPGTLNPQASCIWVDPDGGVWVGGGELGSIGGTSDVGFWDGTSWTTWSVSTIHCEDISGVDATHVWICGNTALGAPEVWKVFFWNGATWTLQLTAPNNVQLHRMSFASATDGWIAGSLGPTMAYLAHWDGATWTPVTESTHRGYDTAVAGRLLHAVCAVAADDVIVGSGDVGGRNGLAEWDGESWQRTEIDCRVFDIQTADGHVVASGIRPSGGATCAFRRIQPGQWEEISVAAGTGGQRIRIQDGGRIHLDQRLGGVDGIGTIAGAPSNVASFDPVLTDRIWYIDTAVTQLRYLSLRPGYWKVIDNDGTTITVAYSHGTDTGSLAGRWTLLWLPVELMEESAELLAELNVQANLTPWFQRRDAEDSGREPDTAQFHVRSLKLAGTRERVYP